MAELNIGDHEMRRYAESAGIDDLRRTRQSRIFGLEPAASSGGRPPVERLLQRLTSTLTPWQDRLGAATEIGRLESSEAEAMLLPLGRAGRKETVTQVQKAIVGAIVEIGARTEPAAKMAPIALREMEHSKELAADVRAVIKSSLARFPQSPAPVKQQQARKPSVT